MNKQQRWIEWIRNLPVWVQGTIGLATAIISFVLLFQKNHYLGVTVLSVLVLVAILYLSLYVAFTKISSPILEGREIYRFGNFRNLGLVGIVFTFVFICLALSLKSSRSYLVTAFTGTSTPTPIPTATMVLSPTPTQVPCTSFTDDKTQIECLIETEAEAVLYQNLNRIMTIFAEDALVIDAQGQEWKGSTAIRARYESLLGVLTFVSMEHEIVEFNISDGEATATTRLNALFTPRPGLYMEALAADQLGLPRVHYNSSDEIEATGKEVTPITSNEKWTFVNNQGIWKVKTFIYGVPFSP